MCTYHSSSTTTRLVVTDYFNWRLKHATMTTNRLYMIVRKVAYECETIYFSKQPTFNFHSSSSSINDIKTIHHEIAKELFSDETITWARILTLISFSAILADYLLRQQENRDRIISSIIDWTTNFIDINLHTWLENQNYWTGCLKFYDNTSRSQYSISRYARILRTLLGTLTFGALYMKRT